MKNTFFLLLSIFVILIAGCNKDEPVEPCTDETNPECSNYNPCFDKEPTSADFGTLDVVLSDKYQTVTSEQDTFYLGSSIVFKAEQEDAASYEWKIGDDDRVFTEREFSLVFDFSDSVSLYNRPLPIRLIVTRTPNTACFPLDDGIDTLTKYIHFVSLHDTEHKNFLGTWVGSREDKPDEVYEIEITDLPDIVLTSGVPSSYYLVFKNINNEGDGSCTFEQIGGSLGYNNFFIRRFVTSNYFDCLHDNVTSPIGVTGIIEKTGNLRIEWTQSYGPDYDESLKIVFNGRKK